MRVITLLNSKGGTGKSTFATHLASGLALTGRRVLIIDADAQANTTSALALPKQPLFHDLIVRRADWQKSILPVQREVYSPTPEAEDGGLFCVAGNIETKSIPTIVDEQTIIAERLTEINEYFDYVIFDTSPTASMLHSMIHAATDYLLLPTQLEGHSALEGLPESIDRANTVRAQAAKYGLDICRVLAILPNMYRAQTATHQQVLGHLQEKYGNLVWTPTGLRIVVPEANLSRQMVFAYAPDSNAAKEFYRIRNRVIKALEGAA